VSGVVGTVGDRVVRGVKATGADSSITQRRVGVSSLWFNGATTIRVPSSLSMSSRWQIEQRYTRAGWGVSSPAAISSRRMGVLQAGHFHGMAQQSYF
jgi:hypothetical protein